MLKNLWQNRSSTIITSIPFVVFLLASISLGDEPRPGHLLIVGGGLRADNAAVYQRLVNYAGGPKDARIGILMTASKTPVGARHVASILTRYGVPAERVQVIDLTFENAASRAFDPDVAQQLR